MARLSDAMLAAFGPDGEYDDAALAAAVDAARAAGIWGALLAGWARALAVTHARDDNPVTRALDQLGDQLDDEARDLVQRHARVVINTARVADDRELSLCWLAVIDRLDDRVLDWLCWTMAVTAAPVLRTLGGLGRFAAVLDVVQQLAARDGADAAFQDVGAVAAALAAVATGDRDAALRYLAVADVRSALSVLLALAGRLLSGGRTVLALDRDGTPAGVADPDDPDVRRLKTVIAAAAAAAVGDRAAALAAMKTVAGGPDDIWPLAWSLALSLGARLGEMFSNREQEPGQASERDGSA
uniref:hypothetical protein n=1 Tax=Amycolatopsis sp. CA-096443 TaxID=3239919 RepID=UPI003F49AD8C